MMASNIVQEEWNDFVEITSSVILNNPQLKFDETIASYLGNAVSNNYLVTSTCKCFVLSLYNTTSVYIHIRT